MKTGVISQRMDIIKEYRETRDAIDIKWHELFMEMNALLVPMPNVPANAEFILQKLAPDFIILSGGNTPVAYGGTSPQRDSVDEELITYAIRKHIPLLGVCRGAQSIAIYFDSTLKKVENHIAVKHFVHGDINRNVNSYHGFAIDDLGEDLRILSRADTDGSIEAIRHKNYDIYGIMWHPEREDVFDVEDLKILKEWLKL